MPFPTPHTELGGYADVGVGRSYCFPIDTYGLSLSAFLSYLLAPKAFPSIRRPARLGHDDKYRSRRYRFVERQKVVYMSRVSFVNQKQKITETK